MRNDPTSYLAFPAPISTNALYANRNVAGKRGRVKTQEYRDWLKQANQILDLQGTLPSHQERVDIAIYCGFEGAKAIDIDNAAKAIIDALVARKIIPNDSRKWVRKAAPEWVHGIVGTIVAIKPSQPHVDRSDLIAWLPLQARGLVG